MIERSMRRRTDKLLLESVTIERHPAETQCPRETGDRNDRSIVTDEIDTREKFESSMLNTSIKVASRHSRLKIVKKTRVRRMQL